MKKLKKVKIHYYALLNTVVLGNVLGVILLVLLIFGINYYEQMKMETSKMLRSQVEQVADYVTDYAESIANSAENLAADRKLGDALDAYLDADNLITSVNGKVMVDYILDSAIKSNSNIQHITLLSGERMVMRDRYGGILVNRYMDKIYKEEWFHQLSEGEIEYQIQECDFYSDLQDSNTYYFYATKLKSKYYSPRDNNEKLVIIIFEIGKLTDYVDTISNNDYVNVNIVENIKGEERIIYQFPEDVNMASYLTKKTDKKDKSIENSYIFIEENAKLIPWKIIGDVSKKSFSRMVYQVEPWILLAIVITLLISIAISFVSAQIISKPIQNLVQAMKDMECGEFHEVESESFCVEIEQLNFTYNQMSQKITELIDNIKTQQDEKRKIEFKMLEAQINPHFIYNTLDAIKWVAHINRADKVVTAIESFVKLLRNSLSSGKEIISVENEIALIKEYVNLMIFRNNSEVEVSYDIAEEVKDCYTLKLVLQPFVENSFFHAFADEQREKNIEISGWIEKHMLVFQVKDNGNGFNVQCEDEKRNQMTGIGISNINNRIKVWYGEEYGVEIYSEKSCGTKITIRQPILRKEQVYGINNDCRR